MGKVHSSHGVVAWVWTGYINFETEMGRYACSVHATDGGDEEMRRMEEESS
jgi:hypothetical protein